MCTIAQELEDRGKQQGMQKGIGALYSLVNKHIITLEMAAEELHVSIEELERLFEKYASGMVV